MTLQSISIVGPTGETLLLPLQDQSSGYFVKDILGLDPVNAAIASTSFGSVDGAQYQSSRLDTRNIVITLGFSPDYATSDVASLRQALYRKLLPKLPVNLIFTNDDGLIVQITGRVETFESPNFTKDPEAKISILCFDPDFNATVETSLAANTNPNISTRDTITYNGAVPTGFKLFVYPNRALTDMAIYLTNSYNEVYSLALTAASLVNADVVEISTVPGEKGAWLTRAPSARKSVLYWLSLVASWPRLTPGANLIRVYAAGAVIPCTLKYTEKYGGL